MRVIAKNVSIGSRSSQLVCCTGGKLRQTVTTDVRTYDRGLGEHARGPEKRELPIRRGARTRTIGLPNRVSRAKQYRYFPRGPGFEIGLDAGGGARAGGPRPLQRYDSKSRALRKFDSVRAGHRPVCIGDYVVVATNAQHWYSFRARSARGCEFSPL